MVALDDSLLFAETGRNALVTFSPVGGGTSVTLSGKDEVLTGTIVLGEDPEIWFQGGSVRKPADASTSFGFTLSEAGGLLVVGAPEGSGTVTIFESLSALTTVNSLDINLIWRIMCIF